jgi:hypothetical protein
MRLENKKSRYISHCGNKIGRTGWSYDGLPGTFYPKRLQKSAWLKYYSLIFDFAEINSAYYKISDQKEDFTHTCDYDDNYRNTHPYISHNQLAYQVCILHCIHRRKFHS